ncbi:MAG: hypothetical protein HYT12_01915 [Candidatus Liptonbacteria bacterium]|nr:hypothetical protein [Candidatus Liptonbacteria bacterium]
MTRTESVFASIDSHVIAWPICNLQIRTRGQYVPVEKVRDHIAARLRENPLKFDGVSWRLWSSCYNNSTGKLTLDVGVGRYSQYRYTNLDPEFRRMFPDQRLWFNTLALGTLVITVDNKIYFSRRPQDAQLSPGRWDIPCGHPSTFEQAPTSDTIFDAVRVVTDKDVELPLRYEFIRPLIQIREEPKYADDLVFVASVRQTSQQIKEAQKPGREISFIDCEADSVALFLRENTNLSRPVYLSLSYFGRGECGEDWFRQFCKHEN